MSKTDLEYAIGDVLRSKNLRNIYVIEDIYTIPELQYGGYEKMLTEPDLVQRFVLRSKELGQESTWSEIELRAIFEKVKYMNTPLYQLLNGTNND